MNRDQNRDLPACASAWSEAEKRKIAKLIRQAHDGVSRRGCGMKPLSIPEGPWHWVANHPDDACAYVRDGKGQEVCVVYGRRDTEQRNATAALLAASRALLAFAECHAALDMPFDQAYEILERHGYRRDYPMSTREFVEALRHTALGKVRMGPAGDLSPPRRATPGESR